MTCPYCDQKEKGRGKGEMPIPVTPDQYERLSRRLYTIEQITHQWEKYSPSIAEMAAIGERLHNMDKKINRIEKMFIKIGVKLFKKATT